MSAIFRYPQLSPTEKAQYNKRHYAKRRKYHQERNKQIALESEVRAWMCTHKEEVERIKVKYEIGAV